MLLIRFCNSIQEKQVPDQTLGPNLWDRSYGTELMGPNLWDRTYGTEFMGPNFPSGSPIWKFGFSCIELRNL